MVGVIWSNAPFERRLGLIGGVCVLFGAVAAVIVMAVNLQEFLQGYLAGFAYWIGLSLGCLSLLMLHHLVAGDWGFAGQRLLEAGALTIPLMALLVLPILLGAGELYPWNGASATGPDPVLEHRRAYMSLPLFVLRTVAYFLFWTGLAVLLRRWSLRTTETAPDNVTRLRAASAVGLILHLMLLTFAGVDWFMSLEPHWFSSIYPWLLAVSHALSALAMAVLGLYGLSGREPIRSFLRTNILLDFGNLILAFVVLWTYMMFAQYLIIWTGNLPEEVGWYENRIDGGWHWLGTSLVIVHFAVPLGILLFRRAKQNARYMAWLSAGLLSAHALFVAWLILPSFTYLGGTTYAAAIATFVGIGGLWLLVFGWSMSNASAFPQHDPRLRRRISGQVNP